MLQPFPKYYIVRPEGNKIPLIPIDELPSWLQIGPWDWSDPTLFEHMMPVAWGYTPRDGEYDVICYYCLSCVDSLHRSVSQNNSASNTSTTVFAPTKKSKIKGLLKSPYMPLVGDDLSPLLLPPALSLPILKQPPFHAHLRSPFVGLCIVSYARNLPPFANFTRSEETRDTDGGGQEPEPTSDSDYNDRSGRGPRGPRGIQGIQGSPGERGPTGLQGQVGRAWYEDIIDMGPDAESDEEDGAQDQTLGQLSHSRDQPEASRAFDNIMQVVRHLTDAQHQGQLPATIELTWLIENQAAIIAFAYNQGLARRQHTVGDLQLELRRSWLKARCQEDQRQAEDEHRQQTAGSKKPDFLSLGSNASAGSRASVPSLSMSASSLESSRRSSMEFHSVGSQGFPNAGSNTGSTVGVNVLQLGGGRPGQFQGRNPGLYTSSFASVYYPQLNMVQTGGESSGQLQGGTPGSITTSTAGVYYPQLNVQQAARESSGQSRGRNPGSNAISTVEVQYPQLNVSQTEGEISEGQNPESTRPNPQSISEDSDETEKEDNQPRTRGPKGYRGAPGRQGVQGPQGEQGRRGRPGKRPPFFFLNAWFQDLDPHMRMRALESTGEAPGVPPYLGHLNDYISFLERNNASLRAKNKELLVVPKTDPSFRVRTKDRKGKKPVRDVRELSPDNPPINEAEQEPMQDWVAEMGIERGVMATELEFIARKFTIMQEVKRLDAEFEEQSRRDEEKEGEKGG